MWQSYPLLRRDEQAIPHFDKIENWVNPFLGEGKGIDRQKFAKLLDEYYCLRGWDPDSGRPTKAKLEQLGLPEVAKDLAKRGLAK